MATDAHNPASLTPSNIYVDGTYLDTNQSWHVEDSPWKAERIHKLLSRHGLMPETVCEVGCGAGEILRQLFAVYSHTHFYGYEPSPQAYAMCAARQSGNVSFLNRGLSAEDPKYSLLLCIDVIEHVEDCLGFLRSLLQHAEHHVFHIPLDVSVRSVLNGHMSRARRDVGHLHYFTMETALSTLEDSGYEVIDHCFTPFFSDFPARTVKGKIAKWPMRLVFALAPALFVRLIGGCSLLVLAKQRVG